MTRGSSGRGAGGAESAAGIATDAGGAVTTTEGASEAGATSGDAGDPGFHLDVGDGGEDTGGQRVGCGDGEVNAALDFIWILHRAEGSLLDENLPAYVSKLSIETGQEQARYSVGRNFYSRTWGRTAVNQQGDVVVNGRLTEVPQVIKNAGTIDRCIDSDGQPGITSSTGADDVLPCRGFRSRRLHGLLRSTPAATLGSAVRSPGSIPSIGTPGRCSSSPS